MTQSGASGCGGGFCLGYTVYANRTWSPNGKWIAFDRTTDSSLP